MKKFQEMIQEYHGSDAGLRVYLLKQLTRMNGRADELLADVMDDIL